MNFSHEKICEELKAWTDDPWDKNRVECVLTGVRRFLSKLDKTPQICSLREEEKEDFYVEQARSIK